MSLQIIIEPPAGADMTEAVIWYKQMRPGLEKDFQLCVQEAISRISRNPQAFPIIARKIRRTLLHRFPYGMFYTEAPKLLRIIAVLHNSRDPATWQTRH